MEEKIDKIENLIEAMAVTMVNGFDHMNTRFDALEQRMDTVEKRIDTIEVRMDSLEDKVTTGFREVDQRFNEMDQKFNARFDEMEESIGAIVHDYHPRIEALEEAVFGETTFA
jgi:predicted  nucleic acid-binding Zn-ribbon protein